MTKKIEQHLEEIDLLKKEIDNMKNFLKPLQERKIYLQRQVSMIKSREKNRKVK